MTFDGFNTLINATAPATFEIKANFREAYSGGAFQITLPNDGLMAIDAMTSSPVAYSSVDSSTFTIGTADATVSASNDPILSQLLLSPSADKALMTFKIQALNDTINIKDLNFTGTNLNKLSNFRLVNSGTVVATATTATSGVVTFGNLATNATSIAKDQTVIYTVIANVNSNTTGTVSLHLNSAVVRGTNGVEVTPTTFTAVHSSTHAISENTLIVAKAANPSKSLTTSALRFNVTAGGKDFVTLTGIAMTNATVGYTTGTVVVYKGDMDHFA